MEKGLGFSNFITQLDGVGMIVGCNILLDVPSIEREVARVVLRVDERQGQAERAKVVDPRDHVPNQAHGCDEQSRNTVADDGVAPL